MYNSMKGFMLKLLKSRKTDINHNKTSTFQLDVTFITFIFCLWSGLGKQGYCQPNSICNLHEGE